MNLVFPEGKKKALTFSYDDGQVFDRRLIGLFRKYGLRGTFHLNADTVGTKGYVTRDELPRLYEDMEIAGHTASHPYLSQKPESRILSEIWEDRKALEQWTGRLVRGFSYPFGETSDEIRKALEAAGIEYARTVVSTDSFLWPDQFLMWNPTCHHNQVTDEMIRHFLHPFDYERNLLFYIWGHSFEFEREQTWDRMEEICAGLGGRNDVWYATNIEIKEYITAVRRLVVSADGRQVYNPSAQSVWIEIGGRTAELPGGEEMPCL